jgi:hypothetical protein
MRRAALNEQLLDGSTTGSLFVLESDATIGWQEWTRH